MFDLVCIHVFFVTVVILDMVVFDSWVKLSDDSIVGEVVKELGDLGSDGVFLKGWFCQRQLPSEVLAGTMFLKIWASRWRDVTWKY